MKIVIYCGYSIEEFSPKSQATGIGGSEEAVIELSRLLVGLENEVIVYCRCGDDEGIYDGVEYINYEYFKDEKTDVIVFWRQPDYVHRFKDKYQAKQCYLWLHDTVAEKDILPVKHFVDGIFVLSSFHASLYPNLRDKLIKTANGLNPDHFKKKVTRNPYKAVYGSSYDRGLKELLEMWPEIKAYEPRAILNVFYGMKGIQDKSFKEEIKHLLKQEGVTELGRIGHEEVAKELLSAGVWLYPCWFPEIFCITSIKAQIAGAIPVITPTGALREMVKFGLTTREPRDHMGDMPWGTEMPEQLMDNFITIARKSLDPKYQKRIRAKMVKLDFSWLTVAKGWNKLFKEYENGNMASNRRSK